MRKLLVGGIAGAALACMPATASAGIVSDLLDTAESTATCEAPAIVNPFLPYGDALDYVLAPGGSFEADDGWILRGGAAQLPGDDPFGLQLGPDEQVLSLPGGSAAISPTMCVDLNYPTFRFATQHLDPETKLRVRVAYPEADDPSWRKAATIDLDGSGAWALTDHLPLEPERGGAEAGARKVAIKLTVSGRDGEAGDGGFSVDDVYVDPRSRN